MKTAHVLEKDILADKQMVSPTISEKHQDIYKHVPLLEMTFSIFNQFH